MSEDREEGRGVGPSPEGSRAVRPDLGAQTPAPCTLFALTMPDAPSGGLYIPCCR